MTKETDIVIVYGWRVTYANVISYLHGNKAGSCDKTIQCVCGYDCWGRKATPEGVTIVKYAPYAACLHSNCDYFITMLEGEQDELDTRELQLPDYILTKGKELAKLMSARDFYCPKIIAVNTSK